MLEAIKGAYVRNRETVKLDLSKVSTVSPPYKGITKVKKVLSSINTSASPRPEVGFFTRDSADFSRAKDILAEGMTLVSSSRLPEGLGEIELDNASKITNATGKLAYAYFNSDIYPWIVSDAGRLFNPDCGARLGKILKSAVKRIGHDDSSLIRMNVDRFGLDGPPCFYKKGSSYGLCPYVPGKSKMNILALLYHNIVAGALASEIRGLQSTDPAEYINMFNGIMSDYSSGEAFHPYGGRIMMISRARPMSLKKPMIQWRVDKRNRCLFADTEEAGFRAGTREIKAVPAFVNLLFSPYSDLFSKLVQHIPGLHVGHQVSSPNLMRRCDDAWSSQGGRMDLHVEDISGYDNSVNSYHLEAFRSCLRESFLINEKTDTYLQSIDIMDIVTANLFDDGPDDVTILQRRGGIPSGFRGTTMLGTMINLITIIDALAQVKSMTIDSVIEKCANLRHLMTSNSMPERECDWGVLLKGDDLIIFSRTGWLNSAEFIEARAAQGIKTDVEPGPIFLMQYIDVRKKTTGRSYPYVPASMINYKTYESYGLILKRLGNRLIFNEHPIRDVRVARLAISANLEDTYFHPLFSFLEHNLLRALNRYDDKEWTSTSRLRSYVFSEAGRRDMLDYSTTVGNSDPFLQELSRRRDVFNSGDDDTDVQVGEDLSSLPPWADEVLDSLGTTDLPSLTSNHGLSNKVVNSSLGEGRGQMAVIDPSRTDGYWLSDEVRRYGRRIFEILTNLQ